MVILIVELIVIIYKTCVFEANNKSKTNHIKKYKNKEINLFNPHNSFSSSH